MIISSYCRFSWNSRVADIVGSEYRLFNDYLTSHITLKDILTHRSGLASINIPIFAAFQENMTTRDLFESVKSVFLPISASLMLHILHWFYLILFHSYFMLILFHIISFILFHSYLILILLHIISIIFHINIILYCFIHIISFIFQLKIMFTKTFE